jgi:IS6 family transposase
MLGFKTFHTAEQTLKGIEAMHMIRKGQAETNEGTEKLTVFKRS